MWFCCRVLSSRDLAVGLVRNWKTFLRYRGAGTGVVFPRSSLYSSRGSRPRRVVTRDPECSHGNFWLCLAASLPWNVDSWWAFVASPLRGCRVEICEKVSLPPSSSSTTTMRDDVEPVEENGSPRERLNIAWQLTVKLACMNRLFRPAVDLSSCFWRVAFLCGS